MANQIEILVKANADGAKKAFGSLTEQIAANRKKIGMGLTGIGAGITGLAALSIKAAQEEAIGISKLDQALKNVGTSYDANKTSIEAVISATQRKTNFGDEEQREVLSKLVAVLGDEEKALMALPAVLDASAASGKSAGTVAQTMSKFLAGLANQSDAVGISVDKSADFTTRLGRVMETVGGQAEATADPFIQFKNRTGDLSQEFGKVLLPIMTDLAGLLDRLTQKVINFTEKHPSLTKWLGLGAAAFGLIALVVGPLLLMLPGLAIAFTAVGVAVNLAMGPVGLIILTIAAVTAGVILLWKNWDTVWSNIKKLTQTVGNFVIGLLNKLTWVWRKQITLILNMVAKLITLGSKLPFVGDKFKKAARAIEGFSDKLDEGIPMIDLTSDATEEMGEAFEEADKTIETANRGITESTQRMGSDVGAALDTTATEVIASQKKMSDQIKYFSELNAEHAKIASDKVIAAKWAERDAFIQSNRDKIAASAAEQEARDKNLAALVSSLSETNQKWTESGASIEEVMKLWSQTTDQSFGEIAEDLKTFGTDINDAESLTRAFTRKTGENFFDMKDDIASALEQATRTVEEKMSDMGRIMSGSSFTDKQGKPLGFDASSMANIMGMSDKDKASAVTGQSGGQLSQSNLVDIIGGGAGSAQDAAFAAIQDRWAKDPVRLANETALFEGGFGEHGTGTRQNAFNSINGHLRMAAKRDSSISLLSRDMTSASWGQARAIEIARQLAPQVGGKQGELMRLYSSGAISAFAKGGVVTRPTLGLIGEAGPEAVIPLGRGSGMGSMNVTVNIAEGAIVGVDDLTDTIAQTVRDVAERGGFRGVF